jgi:hypothetical protein
MNCGFCSSCGITGPHGHVLRDFKNKSKITCPRLLDTKCLYCNEKGHTKLYCEKRKTESIYYQEDYKDIVSNQKTKSNKPEIIINVNNIHSKRSRDYDKSEFNPKRINRRIDNVSTNFLTSAFGALEVEEPFKPAEKPITEEKKKDVPSSSKTWVNIVQHGKNKEIPVPSSSHKTKQQKIQELREKLGHFNQKSGEWFCEDDD